MIMIVRMSYYSLGYGCLGPASPGGTLVDLEGMTGLVKSLERMERR